MTIPTISDKEAQWIRTHLFAAPEPMRVLLLILLIHHQSGHAA